MRHFAALLAALTLSACANNLEQLKELAPIAGDFDSALAAEYLAYAGSEAEQGRKNAASYYAGKGIKAAEHEAVLPDTPTKSLSPETLSDMKASREVLLSLLTDDVKRVSPQAAARSQILYDCWVAEQARQEKSLMPCAEEFRSSIDEVQLVADFFVYGEEAKHTINFIEGDALLTLKSKRIIREIARRMKHVTNYMIELQAYSDEADSLYNERLQAIRDGFITRGMPADKIKDKNEKTSQAVILSSDVGTTDANNAVDIVVRSYQLPERR